LFWGKTKQKTKSGKRKNETLTKTFDYHKSMLQPVVGSATLGLKALFIRQQKK
jgi:hypothetical protein